MIKELNTLFKMCGLNLHEHGPTIFTMFALFTFICIVAQLMLYSKCKQPPWACLVPFYNVVIFLRILGRPAWHIILILLPIVNIYFIPKCLIELSQCFGRKKPFHYILAVVLNVFYVINLGFADADYHGPIYNKGLRNDSYNTEMA